MAKLAKKREEKIKKEDYCPRCLSRLNLFEDVATGQTGKWCGVCRLFNGRGIENFSRQE